MIISFCVFCDPLRAHLYASNVCRKISRSFSGISCFSCHSRATIPCLIFSLFSGSVHIVPCFRLLSVQTIPTQCRERILNSNNFIFYFFTVYIAYTAIFRSFLAFLRLSHCFKFSGIIHPRPAASSAHYFVHFLTFSPYPWGLGNKKHRRKSDPAGILCGG